MRKKNAVIISISSDIGHALALRLIKDGWRICGTYRTTSKKIKKLKTIGAKLFPCDLSQKEKIPKVARQISQHMGSWDALIIAPGAQEPIGLFNETPFQEWEKGLFLNFISQLYILRELLDSRASDATEGPIVMYFAGGGTNDAPTRYSAYTISKIALMKMCELLQAEMPKVRFTIVGPGWVKTKIHKPTFKVPCKAGDNYARTKKRFQENNFIAMKNVVNCCDWLLKQPRAAVGGRNFSVAGDLWGDTRLIKQLLRDPNMYKLRRYSNDWRPSKI